MESKIIQLMPAPAGVYGVTWDDCGNRKEVPLLAVALDELGQITFIYVDGQKVDRVKSAVDHRGS